MVIYRRFLFRSRVNLGLIIPNIWHFYNLHYSSFSFKHASANALRIITNDITIYHTHTQIHNISKRALPDQMIKYKHALMLYKLLRQCTPNVEFIQLNFQPNFNRKLQHHNFLKVQNYSVGNNILLNRMFCLNNNELGKSSKDKKLQKKYLIFEDYLWRLWLG